MRTATGHEFQQLITFISIAISRRLSGRVPEEAIAQVRELVRSECFHQTLWDIRCDWVVHVNPGKAAERRDTLVSVLIAHMIGPLNRVSLPAGVDRAKLIYVILSMMASMLESDMIASRLVDMSERIMRAA